MGITFDSDRPMTVLGVPGWLTHRTIKPGRVPSTWFTQRWVSEPRPISGYRDGAWLKVECHFDDVCNNGHNTFAITANVYTQNPHNVVACGCLHEEIAQVFPELAPLIQWHLVSSDGPLHYLANTLYFAGDRDYNGRKKGEPSAWTYGVRFNDVPITIRIRDSFFRFLEQRIGTTKFRVTAFIHERDPKTFSPNYSLEGFGERWHEAPFTDKLSAEEFCQALNTRPDVELVRIPTAFSEGKARELEAARTSACWPDAPDEILMAEPEVLKAALIERLPALLVRFKATMQEIGFLWSPEDYQEPEKTTL